MNFRELFIDYKIGRKKLKNAFPIGELPFYRQVFLFLVFLWTFFITPVCYFYTGNTLMATLIFLAMSFWYWYQDNKAENLEKMRHFYQKHDLKRMHLIISILKKFKIDITDTETLESLIDEAKKERNEIFLVRLLSKNMSLVTGFASIVYRLYFDLFLKYAMNDMSGIDVEYIFSVLFTFFIVTTIVYFIKEPIIFITM